MLNVVIIGASTAGHIIASQLAPKLPASHRIVIIDPAPTSYWPIASLRAAVVPGFESKVYHRLEQKNFFPANSKNVLVRQRVVSVEPASIVLDGEFEGSSQVPFDVSRSRRLSTSKSIFLTECHLVTRPLCSRLVLLSLSLCDPSRSGLPRRSSDTSRSCSKRSPRPRTLSSWVVVLPVSSLSE